MLGPDPSGPIILDKNPNFGMIELWQGTALIQQHDSGVKGGFMLTRDKIIETANRDWAEFYQCEASLFSKPGSRMVVSERMKGMGRVSIRFIGNHAMISIDEDVREQVEKILAEATAGLSLGMEHFLTFFGNEQIQVNSVTLANLVAEDEIIKPQPPDSRYQLRKLTEADSGKMEKLRSTGDGTQP